METDLHKLKDGDLITKFIIPGCPATKKNSQRVIKVKGFTKVIASKPYLRYESACKSYCEDIWQQPPIDCGIAVKAKIYLNSWRVGDHVGYLQALGDIFQKHGIIKDDKFIHWQTDNEHWFGGVDKDNPRVEIEITRFRHPIEQRH